MANKNLFKYVLSLGDDALVSAQRLAQWAYKAPFLEEDIALSNISLDLFGRASLFLDYAAELKGGNTTADDLAFKRNERQFTNFLICEHPNGNFADTVVRNFLLDAYYKLFLEKLAESKDKQLAAISEKAIKENNYHFRHSSKWVIRLGDGTMKSHSKVQTALINLWMYTGEFFEMNDVDQEMSSQKIGVNREALKSHWTSIIMDVLKEAALTIPEDVFMTVGGRDGIHTEHLGHLLSDMQYLQRAYPDAIW